MVFFRSSKAFNLSNIAADVYEEPEVLESVEVCKSVLHHYFIMFFVLHIMFEFLTVS